MKELSLFKRQFILTVYANFDLPWRSEKILNYNLFYHPELEFEHTSEKDFDLYLLGFIFDFENPAFSNKQILDSLSRTNSFDNFIDNLSKYSGHYVIIYRLNKRLILINDACAQQEYILISLIPLLDHNPYYLVKSFACYHILLLRQQNFTLLHHFS